MKTLLVPRFRAVLLQAGLLLATTHSTLQAQTLSSWQSTLGPYDGQVNCLIKGPDGYLYAGTIVGVFRTPIDHDAWELLSNGILDRGVTSLAMDSSGVLYAGSGQDVFRSVDEGVHWEITDPGPGNTNVHTVQAAAHGVLVAGTDDGIYRSTDRAASWSKAVVDTPNAGILCLGVHPGGLMYAGTAVGLMRSTDHGQHWSYIRRDGNYASLAINQRGVIAVLVYGFGENSYWSLVNYSLDSGATFVGGLPNNFPELPRCVALDDANHLFIGIVSGWNDIYFGYLTRFQISEEGIAVRLVDDRGGAVWVLDGDIQRVFAVGDHLAFSSSGSLTCSTDSGATFHSFVNGLTASRVLSLADNGERKMFAGTSYGLFRPSDTSFSWNSYRLGGHDGVFPILSLASNSAGLMVAGSKPTGGEYKQIALWSSVNHGTTWGGPSYGTWRGRTNALAVSSWGQWFGTNETSVWRGDPSPGSDKQLLITNSLLISIALNDSGQVYAGSTDGKVYCSYDSGTTWTSTLLIQSGSVQSLATSPGRIFAGTSEGFFSSSDRGAHWAQRGLGAIPTNIRAVVASTVWGIFVGTPEGVYHSTDEGESWQTLHEGMQVKEVYSLSFGSDSFLYAGTSGGGVYRLPLNTSLRWTTIVLPRSALVGSSITISGLGFSSAPTDNAVYLGAILAQVISARPDVLRVTVPPGSTFAPVTVAIGGRTAVSREPFSPTFNGVGGFGTFSFASKVEFAASGQLVRGTIADVDGDGKPDVIEANANTNAVSIFRNTATPGTIDGSSFAAAVDIPVGMTPYQVMACDFNSDGKLDLVSANNNGNNISILISQSTRGSISFSRNDYVVPAGPYSIAAGDFDQDGRLDLVVSSTSGASLSIFRNTTTGGVISFANRVDIGIGFMYFEVAVSDIDGDGKQDLVVARAAGTEQTGALSIFRNMSTPGVIAFASSANFSVGQAPRGIATGDLDGDGKQDVVITSGLGANLPKAISLFRNTSSASAISFAPRLDYSNGVDSASATVQLADLDGDGKLDMAVPLSWTAGDRIGVYQNMSGPGSLYFSAKTLFASGQDPAGVLIGDLDLDGKPDLVASRYATSGVSILRNSVPTKVERAVKLVVSGSGGNRAVLYFGLSSQASNGEDVALGELELPQVPPPGVFDARFLTPSLPSVGMVTDYRSDTSTTSVWRLTFQPGTAGYPITLQWFNASALGGHLRLLDEVGDSLVDVNMVAQSGLVLTSAAVSSLKIVHETKLTWSVPVVAGWNMVSVPLDAANMSASSLFPGAVSQAFSFTYRYEPEPNLTCGMGYWLKFPSSSSYSITGFTRVRRQILLAAGWQMIGPLETDIPVGLISTSPAGIIQGSFYGFSSGYHAVTVLESGKGYWVKSSQNGMLTLPPGPAKAAASENRVPDVTLRIEDATGQSCVVYLARPDNLGVVDELPPLPPSGILDVRYSSNSNVESLGAASHIVRLTSAVYPIKINAMGIGNKIHLCLKDGLGGVLVNANLEENRAITVIQNLSELILESRDVPIEFSLSQNYPNPFNPTTTMKYGLPSRIHVTLAIYNTLGQMVTQLVDSEIEPGYHEVIFRADRLASGVYFYRMTAGSFVQTRKFLLLK